MRLISRILVTTLLVFTLVVTSFAFDQSPSELKEFNFGPEIYRDLSDSIVSVMTFGTGMGWYPDKTVNGIITYKSVEGVFYQQGSGVVVRARNGTIYVLTNRHVIHPTHVRIKDSTVSTFSTPNLRTNYQFVFVGQWNEPTAVRCTIVWQKESSDIAILKPEPNIFLKPIPYQMLEFGMSEKIHQGDAATIVTGYRDPDPKLEVPVFGFYPEREWYYEARNGKVLEVGPKVFNDSSHPWFNMNDVTTNIKVYPGDSGSPVFMYENGVPYLVGLARAYSLDFDPLTGEVLGAYYYFCVLDELVLRRLATPNLD